MHARLVTGLAWRYQGWLASWRQLYHRTQRNGPASGTDYTGLSASTWLIPNKAEPPTSGQLSLLAELHFGAPSKTLAPSCRLLIAPNLGSLDAAS